MRNLIFILLVCCAFTTKAQNLVHNGSFEQNTETQCYHSMNKWDWDSTVAHSTMYGGFASLLKDSCVTCAYLPNYYWGGGAQEGHWFATVYSEAYYNQPGTIWLQSKFSLALDTPLNNESNYRLSFYIKEPPYPQAADTTPCVSVKNNYIHLGISNSDTTFGTHLFTTPLGGDDWTKYSLVFHTANAEQHLTIEVGVGDTNNYVLFIDNFSIEATSDPVGIDILGTKEPNVANKKLIKIVDILGRESKPIPNTMLFYIYDNGTVEKRIILD